MAGGVHSQLWLGTLSVEYAYSIGECARKVKTTAAAGFRSA
jgi:hypothetical protein